MTELEFTGERWVHGKSLVDVERQHLARYQFVSPFVAEQKVLDLCCGAGYGTYLISKTATYVVGLDIAADAIEYAKSQYSADNLGFIVGDALDIPLPDGTFEVVVLFEGVEHVSEYRVLLKEARRMLVDGGRFFVSTPNKAIRPGSGIGRYHTQEWFIPEFKELIGEYFNDLKWCGQLNNGVVRQPLEETDTFIIGVGIK